MCIIAILKDEPEIVAKIVRITQSIWLDDEGDSTHQVECVVRNKGTKPLSKMKFIIPGIIRSVNDRTELLNDDRYCNFIYSDHFVRTISEKNQNGVMKGEIEAGKTDNGKNLKFSYSTSIKYHIEPLQNYTEIIVTFPFEIQSDENFGFIFLYQSEDFAQRLPRPTLSSLEWICDVRIYDPKTLQNTTVIENLLKETNKLFSIDQCYTWIVLPKNSIAETWSPTVGGMRTLETKIWKKYMKKYYRLEENGFYTQLRWKYPNYREKSPITGWADLRYRLNYVSHRFGSHKSLSILLYLSIVFQMVITASFLVFAFSQFYVGNLTYGIIFTILFIFSIITNIVLDQVRK